MISKDAVREFLSRDLDSFTWMKRMSRERLEDELKRIRPRPVFKTNSWDHQLVCFLIAQYLPEFMFLLDMGAGKSKILLDVMTQRRRSGKLTHGIITVPRLINLGTWEEAIRQHSDFEPNLVTGSSLEEKWEALAHPKGDITVIDYAGLQYALSSKNFKPKNKKKKYEMVSDERKIRQVARQYSFFGMDESHKSKNKDSTRFSVMRKLMKNIPYRYGTTGTLFGRNPEDAWGQFYLIDQGETLGEHIGMFREAFFEQVQGKYSLDYVFRKEMYRTFYKFLNHRSIRYTEDELDVNLPARQHLQVTVRFPDEQMEHYQYAVQGLINARGNLRELDAQFIRMRQIVAGFLEWSEEGERQRVVFKDNPKLDAIERLVSESGDSKLVISHEYTLSGELITKRLNSMGIDFEWLYGKSSDPVNSVKRFLANPNKKVFVMNSESGGTGTDGLQQQCQYLIFYESPASPITRQQVIKRVHRPGQTKRCWIYDLVMAKSVDLRLLKMIEEGIDLHKLVVDGRFPAEGLLA